MGLFFSLNYRHFVIIIIYYVNLYTFSWNHRKHVPLHNHNHNQYTNQENISSQLHHIYIQNNTYSTCYLSISITMTMQHNPLIGNCNHTIFIFFVCGKTKSGTLSTSSLPNASFLFWIKFLVSPLLLHPCFCNQSINFVPFCSLYYFKKS